MMIILTLEFSENFYITGKDPLGMNSNFLY